MVDYVKLKKKFDILFDEVGKVIVGQRDVIEQVVIAILCNANALLESYPGLGKTLMIRTIADSMNLKFSRIQNTPDLMPSDITGTQIIEESKGSRSFKFQKGPLFANIVLADEINRATPKTQAALLEAMQEKQVTVGNDTHKLDLPFFVLATQNPIEQEGTYQLPEAQTDRFLLKILVTYPSREDEHKILERFTSKETTHKTKSVLDKESIVLLQKFTRQVPIAKDLQKRIIDIVANTRAMPDIIEYGASPRASIGLTLAAKARAILLGRAHVSEKDIAAMAYPVLRHRIVLNFEAERKGMSPDDAIKKVLEKK